MPQSLSLIIVHCIFSTKDRKRWLDDGIRGDMHAYLATVARNLECSAYRIGGVEDHIHMALRLPRTMQIADCISKLKTSSSTWVKNKGGDFSQFEWQRGYGAFSISPPHLDDLLRYIDKQDDHHRTTTFKEEYLGFLRKYRIEYNEEYLWE